MYYRTGTLGHSLSPLLVLLKPPVTLGIDFRQHFRLYYRPLEERPKVNRRLNPRVGLALGGFKRAMGGTLGS